MPHVPGSRKPQGIAYQTPGGTRPGITAETEIGGTTSRPLAVGTGGIPRGHHGRPRSTETKCDAPGSRKPQDIDGYGNSGRGEQEGSPGIPDTLL